MNKNEASKLIAQHVDEAQRLLKLCETLADENNLAFSFNPAYGMGGTYIPDPKNAKDWDSSGCEWDNSGCYQEDYGWNASSAHC